MTEALRSGRAIDSILIAKGELNGSIKVIAAKAKAMKIPIKEVDRKKLDLMCGGAVHQGVAAVAAVKEYASVEDIFALAESRNEPPFIIVLDEIEDAHNLGAIIRTAECAGAHGIIIPKRRSAGLSYAVGKTSAGAYEYMPVARVTNIPTVLDELKERGCWVYGADMNGSVYTENNLKGAAALVIGSEGNGIGKMRQRHDIRAINGGGQDGAV